MRFKVANYSRLEIRLDTLHICIEGGGEEGGRRRGGEGRGEEE